MKKTNIITIIIIGILLIAGLFLLGKLNALNSQKAQLNSGIKNPLTPEELLYDFGTISMAAGNVSHVFKIKNAAAEPVIVQKIYTSCMCTSASLETADGKLGPFGMAGHGFIPKINKTIKPGEEANIEVVFDPNAHGPAGVGPIDRVVYLDTESYAPLELQITAVVTP